MKTKQNIKQTLEIYTYIDNSKNVYTCIIVYES